MARICVGDLEADGLLKEATRVWCGVFKDVSTKEVFKFTPEEIPQMLSFLDTVDVLVMHNGVGYDWPLLEKLYGYEYKGGKVDTLLMSRLQKPNRMRPQGCTAGPHSVEAWGIRFGHPKPEHEDWSQFSPEMLHRCEQDVEIQEKIFSALRIEGRGHDWKAAHILTRDVFEILQKQEEYGWLVDTDRMERSIKELTRWITKIDAALQSSLPMLCIPDESKTKGVLGYIKKPFKKNGEYSIHVLNYMEKVGWDPKDRIIGGVFTRVHFRRVDLGSLDETKKFLLDSGWIPLNWNTDKEGNRTSPKMDKNETFEGVQGSMGSLIVRRIQYRHRRSQIEGWMKVVRDDNRISQGISGIASTGRLTHQRIVNVPGSEALYGKQMRKIFVAKEGYSIVGVDSAGCQNRMLASRVNDPAFTETLINGKKEDETSIHFVNQKAIARTTGVTLPYGICKNVNYAFLFGASDNKLASTANLPSSMGPKIREGLLSVSPGLEKIVNELAAEWKSTASRRAGKYGMEYFNGSIKGLDGRPVLVESEHCLLVYMLQSDEAILMQYALVFLYRWLKEKGWVHGREYGFVANVHDEIQAEVRDDLLQEYAELAERSIEYAGEYLGLNCPHEGGAEIGKTWYDTH